MMRRLRAAALVCLLLAPARAFAAPAPFDADVLVQAGHEGRPDCAVEPASLCNNTGAAGEIELTPKVADEVARLLRAAGISVIRVPAHFGRDYRVRDALFLHFDGSTQPCGSAASVGYPDVANSRVAAQQWKAIYAKGWTFGFEPDNFTPSLRTYYGYKHAHATDAAVLVEGGEVTCPAQAAWIHAHWRWEAAALAHFLALRLHRDVAAPARP
jgi:hypothetical protein